MICWSSGGVLLFISNVLQTEERQSGCDLDHCIRSATQGFLAETVRHKENVISFKSHVRTLPGQDFLEIDRDLLTLPSAGPANDHGMIAPGGWFEIFSDGHQLQHRKMFARGIQYIPAGTIDSAHNVNDPCPRYVDPVSGIDIDVQA